jgi:hypothetical protein
MTADSASGTTSPSPSPRVPRLHVAFPVFRALPASPGEKGLSLDRAFFDQARIANPLASVGAHARLETSSGGEVFLVEAGGQSGTFVNGFRLAPNERVALTEGTVLRIGTTVMVYREGTALAEAPTKDALAAITKQGVRHTFIGPFSLPVIAKAVARLGDLGPAAASVAATAALPSLVFLAGGSRPSVAAIADWLHETARTNRPFLSVQTAGLTEDAAVALLAGAPEGAVDERVGLLGLANGGTLFLDDIVDLPPRAQEILLGFLDTGGYPHPDAPERAPRRAELLVLVASSSALAFDEASLVARGVVPDLAARLVGRIVKVPALSERREDLGALTLHVLSQRAGQASVDIEAAAVEMLLIHDWPGDLPELHAALDRALGSTRRLMKSALPGPVLATRAQPSTAQARASLADGRREP